MNFLKRIKKYCKRLQCFCNINVGLKEKLKGFTEIILHVMLFQQFSAGKKSTRFLKKIEALY